MASNHPWGRFKRGRVAQWKRPGGLWDTGAVGGHNLRPGGGHWPVQIRQWDRRQNVSKPFPHRLRGTVITKITIVCLRRHRYIFNLRSGGLHAQVACSAFYSVLEDVYYGSGRLHGTLCVTSKKAYGCTSGVRGVWA